MATTNSVYWMKLMLCCIIFIHQIIRNMQIFHHSSCYLVNVTDDSNFKGHLFSIFFLYPLKGTDQNRTTIGKREKAVLAKGKKYGWHSVHSKAMKALHPTHTHFFPLIHLEFTKSVWFVDNSVKLITTLMTSFCDVIYVALFQLHPSTFFFFSSLRLNDIVHAQQ